MDFLSGDKYENAGAERESRPAILIVEDDKFFGEILVKKFTEESFLVEHAADGASALRSFAKYTPQCVLLDAELPDMDGFEVLQKMRKDPTGSKIPIIMIGNLNRQEDMRRALSFGANEFLPKMNFTSDEIVAHVRNIMREHYIELR